MSNKAKILFLLTLFLGIFFEASITSMPLVFNILLVWFIISADNGIFFLSFVCGLLLDVLLVRKMGLSSLYLIIALYMIVLYEKKFKMQTVSFVLLSSFLGSLSYLILTQQSFILQQAIVSAFLSMFAFRIVMLNSPALSEAEGFQHLERSEILK